MKIGIIQLEVKEGNKEKNLDNAISCILQAPQIDLFILPELWSVGYFYFEGYLDEAEEVSGETVTKLIKAAKQRKTYIHTGSIVEVAGDQYYNTSFLISPVGDIIGQYRKIHLFSYNSQEPSLLSAGKSTTVVSSTSLGNVGMATCYDLRFPEQFRAMLELGADLVTICAAWPYPRLNDWQLFNRVRAIENQSFIVSANAVGSSKENRYLGHSMVVNPRGEVVAQADDEETLLMAEIDLHQVKRERKRFPAVRDFLEGKMRN